MPLRVKHISRICVVPPGIFGSESAFHLIKASEHELDLFYARAVRINTPSHYAL